MRLATKNILGVALVMGTMGMTQADVQPYYNPANGASPSGYTIGYELFRTIGCPGKALLDPPCAVPAKMPPPAPYVASSSFSVVTLKGVNFNFNSADLRPEAKKTLDKVAANLKAQGYPHIQIAGFTDSVGSDAYNLSLSDRRAKAVKAYLVGKGVPASSLTAKGYGETNFLATNKTAEGRAENRRVELRQAE